jgi:hypothetical protein
MGSCDNKNFFTQSILCKLSEENNHRLGLAYKITTKANASAYASKKTSKIQQRSRINN